MGRGLPHGRAGPRAEMSLDARRFILENTSILTPPHVPEVRLRLAGEAHDLWHKTEDELGEIGLPPPFWAFAWAGGQGLARYVLDNPALVKGKRVIDFASGSGLVGIAAMLAGAAEATCADIDPFSMQAIALNAELNNVTVKKLHENIIGSTLNTEALLAGDVFFDRQLASELIPWFQNLAARGVDILIGDPGRTYLPKQQLEQLAAYDVRVPRALEDAEVKRTTVWRFR
jgi:predicted nicotinamide N-methyase